MPYILIWEVVTQMCTYIKMNSTINLRFVLFIVCNLYFNKKLQNWRQNKDISRITKIKRINHLKPVLKEILTGNVFAFMLFCF